LLRNARTGVLHATIVAVVSNHAEGGVFHVAQQYQVPFMHFTGPFNAEEYQKIIEVHGAEWVALSGWLKLAAGLDPQRTINIHPGPLPRFGGKGMYGKHVHAAVVEAFKAGEVTTSHVTMHFVTPQYDEGPVIFRYPILVEEGDDGPALGERVNKVEHGWQSYITNLVVNGLISWDGKDPKSLKVPEGYQFLEAKY
jgi:phosphoribosylglycinamide formyltransferase-1